MHDGCVFNEVTTEALWFVYMYKKDIAYCIAIYGVM